MLSRLRSRREIRLLVWGLAGALAVSAWLMIRPWWWMIPRRLRVRAWGWTLEVLRGSHAVLWVLLPLSTLILGFWLVRRRRQGRPARLIGARLLLLSASSLVGLAGAELGVGCRRAWLGRDPVLPTTFPAERGDRPTLELVVVGESSARGNPFNSPYQPGSWLSIGQILEWQLQRAFPERRVHAAIVAAPGNTLAEQHRRLAGLTRRPDVMIIYCGHNEYQSSFSWMRMVLPQGPTSRWVRLRRWLEGISPVDQQIRQAIAKNGINLVPPPTSHRQLIEWPVLSADEAVALRANFERRLEVIVAYCERVGAVPVLIIPPANDAGYEPNRSVVTRILSQSETSELARRFYEAQAAADDDPKRGIALWRAFLVDQPQFAEAHYRLARLLQRAGDFEDAYEHFVKARDLDGFPQRCPSDLQNAYRKVAARHPSALLIDGQALFRSMSPYRILDDNLFHDAMHPALAGHIALAQAIMAVLHDRRAIDWPENVATPVIDPVECADHFGMSQERWFRVCDSAARFYDWVAHARFDPSGRYRKMMGYLRGARLIREGNPPDRAGVPGLGTHPAWFDGFEWYATPPKEKSQAPVLSSQSHSP